MPTSLDIWLNIPCFVWRIIMSVCLCVCVWQAKKISHALYVDLQLYACLPTCIHRQWWAAGCWWSRLGSDLRCEKRNTSERRGEEKKEKLEERRGSVPTGLVCRTLSCCAGDGFLQCSRHIITFTHFCPVSRSTEASPSWDKQQKSCREVKPSSGLQLSFKKHALTKFINKRLQVARFLLNTYNINTIFHVQ